MDWTISQWLVVFAIVGGALSLWWLHLRYWGRRLSVPTRYDLEERCQATDGGAYELRRLRGDGRPVLLVHGIAVNHRTSDALPDVSLAQDLARRGFDVWLLTLRSGLHAVPWRRRPEVRFDAMARFDVPEAIASIQRHRAEECQPALPVHYVGHSMGGMLLMASVGRFLDDDALDRVVIVGSPGRVVSPIRALRILARWPRPLMPMLPLRLAARTYAFASEWFPTPIHRLFVNPAQLHRGTLARTLAHSIESIPAPLVADFATWIASDGELRLPDGTHALDGLEGARSPALFIAGAADRIAPPDTVRRGFEAWGAESGVDKHFVVLDDHRCDQPYGHGDMMFGVHAPRDVFQQIADYLGDARCEGSTFRPNGCNAGRKSEEI